MARYFTQATINRMRVEVRPSVGIEYRRLKTANEPLKESPEEPPENSPKEKDRGHIHGEIVYRLFMPGDDGRLIYTVREYQKGYHYVVRHMNSGRLRVLRDGEERQRVVIALYEFVKEYPVRGSNFSLRDVRLALRKAGQPIYFAVELAEGYQFNAFVNERVRLYVPDNVRNRVAFLAEEKARRQDAFYTIYPDKRPKPRQNYRADRRRRQGEPNVKVKPATTSEIDGNIL